MSGGVGALACERNDVRRRVRIPWLIVLGASLLAASCSGTGATAPSNARPGERVSGVWIGKATLTAVSGGECVGATVEPALGSRDLFAASVRQDGTALAATLAYQGNRTSCEWGGATGAGGVGLELTSCHSGRVEGFRCANGAVRDLQMRTGRLTADATNGTGVGRDITVWSVFPAGSSESLGTLTLTADFRWNLSRIPHDDFHIFDGSILAGYVDGVVTIPEEPDPFCTVCGWLTTN